MPLTWLKYVDRSYQQIKDSVLTRLQSLVPEITDHTESNPFVQLVSIWSGLIEMLGYYLDNQARETSILSCRLWSSAVKIANLHDYRIRSSSPATVEILFLLNTVTPTTINIPAGTKLSTANGIEFITTEAGKVLAGKDRTYLSATQMKYLTTPLLLGGASGLGNEEFELPITVQNVAHNTVDVRVNGLAWNRVETLAYSLRTGTDYVQDVNASRKVVVRFGDGIYGAKLQLLDELEATYAITEGANGNVGANSITTLVSSLTLPVGITVSVTNPNRASGGYGMETLEDLRGRVPKAIRTLFRCVSKQDYVDVTEIHPSIAKASIEFTCGKSVSIFVVPVGGGIAANSLLNSVVNWLENKRMVTTKVNVLAAGEVRLTLAIDLTVKSQYQNTTIANEVKQRLLDFLSYRSQNIGGSLQLSDLYEVIETTVGVMNSTIVSLVPKPYARPLSGTANPLVWTNTVLTSTSVNYWKVIITSPIQFQVLKNNNFQGTFVIGSLVTFSELSFTVTGSYLVGDQWEFYTYPTGGTFSLQEQSMIVSLPTDISINAIGGY